MPSSSDPDKFTGATPFLFLFAVVIIFLFGPGKLSLDALVVQEDRLRLEAPPRPRRELFVHNLGVGHEIVQAAMILPEDKAHVRDPEKETQDGDPADDKGDEAADDVNVQEARGRLGAEPHDANAKDEFADAIVRAG